MRSNKDKIRRQLIQLQNLESFISNLQVGERVILSTIDQDITLGVDEFLLKYLQKSRDRIFANILRLKSRQLPEE